MLPRSLIAYDANGEIVATLDYCIAKDDEGNVIGLIDFAAHEQAGGRLRDLWESDQAVGSATWPEWLQGAAYDFKVELDPNPGTARARIKSLVHKASGHKRERAVIEAEITSRIAEKRAAAKVRGNEIRTAARAAGMKAKDADAVPDPEAEPADLRDLLGGPNRPLLLDADGKTRQKQKVQRPNLPVIKRANS